MKHFSVLEKALKDTLEGYPESFWSLTKQDSVRSQKELLERVRKKFKRQEEERMLDIEILGDLLAILCLYTVRAKDILLIAMVNWLREIILTIPSDFYIRPTETETFLRYRRVECLLEQAAYIESEWIFPLVQLINVEIKFIKEHAENERTVSPRASRS